MKKFIVITLALLCFCNLSHAQKNWQERIFMQYYVETPGDTVFVDELPAAVVFPRIRKNGDPDIKKYYKLVYNFNKVYPYTDVARVIIERADSVLTYGHLSKAKKEKYVNSVQKEILDNFTDVVKHMSISQGQLLCRLVDREVGMTSFDIVKGYKSKVAANFWQGVAKMFKQNLKSHYDPKGEDVMTEYLIEKWDQGQFEALYFSIYGVWPAKTAVPSQYK